MNTREISRQRARMAHQLRQDGRSFEEIKRVLRVSVGQARMYVARGERMAEKASGYAGENPEAALKRKIEEKAREEKIDLTRSVAIRHKQKVGRAGGYMFTQMKKPG